MKLPVVEVLLFRALVCAGPILAASNCAWGQALALPICPGDSVSKLYALSVDGQDVPVGTSKFNGKKEFHIAAFEIDATTGVRLRVPAGAEKALRVRPSRLQRQIHMAEGIVQFAVEPGEKLVVEAGPQPPLFLFALPLESKKPPANGAGIVYFGPGEHTAGEIELKSGQTLYLAAGARVRGRVRAFEARDITIRGRGVLDARDYTDFAAQTHGILIERCQNISIEGIQLRTGDWWQILLLLSNDVRIDHLHTLSFGRNNDGVDTDGVGNLHVRDSFIGCGDDGFGIHAVDAVVHGEPATHDCLIERCVIWNEFAGNGLRVGASTETEELHDITFRSIDVLHCINNAIMIDHSDWAHLRNIAFENFHNDTPKPLAKIVVDKTGYSNKIGFRDKRGRISGLRFRDATSALGGISIRGYDNQHRIQGVDFFNCRIGDRLVRRSQDLSIGDHVSDVQFTEHANPAVGTVKPRPTSQQAELVVDNDSPASWAFAGKDLNTVDSTDSYGGTAWRLGRLGPGCAAVYEPHLTGLYEVAVHWGTHEGVATAAPWTVFHAEGYTTRVLDQNRSAGWHVLGEFELGPDSWVRLVDPHYPLSDGPVIADAVRFRRIDRTARPVQRD